MTDITERKQTEEKIHLYQEQLRTLVSELSFTEERERRQIAMDLHDYIGQALAITKIKLGALQELTFSPDVSDPLREIRELVEQAIQYSRSLTSELSPPILYELGLEAAIGWLTKQIQKQHGMMIEFENDEQPKPVDDRMRSLLFQCVRELLINVVKHAQAQKAKVIIRRDKDAIVITVQDDGVGFETSEMSSSSERMGGFGLFSIKERLNYLGGNFEIESGREKGTRVAIVVPLRREEKNTKEK
jgi:signal transduction histidine kinase